jgi:CubicO group peptidase (beta-lactamase class C family)
MRFGLPLVLAVVLTTHLDAQRFAAVDAAIDRGIAEHVFPGAVVVVGRSDTVLYAGRYGHFTWSPHSRVPDPAITLWDLASLTKIVATMSSAAVLVQQHRLNLDARVSEILPRFTGGLKNEVTVRMLLDHTSGMPPYTRLWLSAHTPEQARALVFAVPLQRAPGASAVYSDLNGMLAGLVVEQVTGKPLEQAADSLVFRPLGMLSTRYRPIASMRSEAAPTGKFRGTPVAGVVNDQNAVALGGVSGHAGLFSTGYDLARFAQAWLKSANGHGDWLSRPTTAEFFSHSAHSGTRVLGWDTADPPTATRISLYGRCATPTTYGHTGWTGTEIWIDPAANLFVVLLTNRSFDPANAKASFGQLKDVRLHVADAVRTAVGKCDTNR